MAEDKIRRLAGEQRKRLIAGLLNAVEGQPWYKQLNDLQRKAYRQEVFDRVGIYHDFMIDIIKIVDDDDSSIVNDHAVDLIQQIHTSQQRLEHSLRTKVPGG